MCVIVARMELRAEMNRAFLTDSGRWSIKLLLMLKCEELYIWMDIVYECISRSRYILAIKAN